MGAIMSRRSSIPTITVLIVLAVALGATVYALTDVGWRRPFPAPYDQTDKPLVDRALDIYGGGSMSRKDVLRTRYPVVVRLPEMTCVGLNLRRWMLGQDRTICFRNSDGEVVVDYHS